MIDHQILTLTINTKNRFGDGKSRVIDIIFDTKALDSQELCLRQLI